MSCSVFSEEIRWLFRSKAGFENAVQGQTSHRRGRLEVIKGKNGGHVSSVTARGCQRRTVVEEHHGVS